MSDARPVPVLFLIVASRLAFAQDNDESALALADRTTTEPTRQRACIEYSELAGNDTTYSDDRASSPGGRASFSFRCDAPIASDWRGVLSDRFDEFWARGSSARAVNTLKESYLGFRYHGAMLVDVGRINIREGAGLAYNPTDYLKAGAVRALISIDPNTLRDERMGTLMGRVQALWSSGSVTTLFAPRVGAEPNDSTFNPDFGTTNAKNRWLIILSQRLTREFQPQVSLTGTEHESPRAGLNLTYLLNSATVGYVEWSGGRSTSDLFRSNYGPTIPGDTAFHSQLSTGFTYTTSFKLSTTLEYQYNNAAPDDKQWAALRSGPIPPYVRYREYVAGQGELATRQNLFAYAHWDDVGINRLGLTAFVRFDPYDHSRVTWTEARYHWDHAGFAVQWQRNVGDATSDLAPFPVRQSWLALMDYYF